MLALPDPPLADEAVVLRPFSLADADAVAAACADPEIRRFTAVPSPYAVADARAWIEGQAATRRDGEALELAVTDAADDGLLGAAGLVRLDWASDVAEVGYWVAPGVRGRGVAARAVRLLARHAVDELGIVRVEARISTHNAASQRAAERAGMQREGVLRSAFSRHGERHDVVVYALLAGELAPRTRGGPPDGATRRGSA